MIETSQMIEISQPLPLPRTVVTDGILRALEDQVLRVDVAGQIELIPALADLSLRAFGVRVIADSEDPDVILVDEDVRLPAPEGIDPRPSERVGRSEAYRIRTDGDRLRLSADSAEGYFRGLVTLAGSCTSGLPAISVDDHPRFAWRGLSLDVVRRWFPADEVRRVIDLLALHKLNVLHLHLTDTQGWRFSVPGYPELASPDHYSGDELRALEEYARERFVTIVPEVDVPGHVSESLVAIDGVEVTTGRHPFFAYLDIDAPGVRTLLTAAFAHLAAAFASPRLHLGGDEAFGAPHEVYLRTVAGAAEIIRSQGREPIGWQEAVRAGVLGSDGLVQLWIAERDRFDAEKVKRTVPDQLHALVDQAASLFDLSLDDAGRIGVAGLHTIVSSSDPLYLDRRPSEPSRRTAQNSAHESPGSTGYDPVPTISVLDWDPAAQADIDGNGIRIAGIEAALWCETVGSFADAATLLLPRLGLVAQQAWGAASPRRVLAAAAASESAWTGLGFADFYRSSEIFDS